MAGRQLGFWSCTGTRELCGLGQVTHLSAPQSFISRGLIPVLLSIVTTNRANGNENACSTVKSSPRINHCSLLISWNTEGRVSQPDPTANSPTTASQLSLGKLVLGTLLPLPLRWNLARGWE